MASMGAHKQNSGKLAATPADKQPNAQYTFFKTNLSAEISIHNPPVMVAKLCLFVIQLLTGLRIFNLPLDIN
jgi:hypothetical protein